MKHLDISIDENMTAWWKGMVIGHIEKGEDGEHFLALTAPIHIIEQMSSQFIENHEDEKDG